MNAHSILFFVVLIITIYVLWKEFWRIQILYNSGTFGIYTPDSFPIAKEYEDDYNHITRFGFYMATRRTVVMCALLRDVADKIPEIRKRMEKIGRVFKDYRIVIVENDSADNTRKLLNEWRLDNPKVIILGCGINSDVERCHAKHASKKTEGHSVDRWRIEKMTYLRNIYLDYVKRYLSKFNYMIVWDIDIVGSVYTDGVANSIGHFNYSKSEAYNADSICAYGIYRWGWLKVYYDTYAHIDKEDQFHIDLKTVHDIKKGLGVRYSRGEPPVNVVSCFSGFTIYQIPSLLREDIKYDMSPPGNLECEHVRLHKKLHRVYLNPSMIHYVLLNK